ncbi:hypothetical protein AN189_11400 [Loktanella sp. 3ANDIMAR09]|uniref:Crp/Fnr family transcriptional regulator n=1 Tax=Loktanella sp. 3ANDIMAR09 TaxID=1225657 RepID=UPI0006FEAA76|nr:cyclic nucleotide-binding domain-containing protein [Loktanella sp. 3ANDIMAR09]KQI68391.1 hypothetical protein AN189_11400 [Loktanella sp. 3ANDIMAR09]
MRFYTDRVTSRTGGAVDISYLFTAGIFVQIALLFYVLGLLVRNELLLRGLLLIGTMFYILYYFFVSDVPLWDAIFASAMIGLANVIMILVILREKSTLGMSDDMLVLYGTFTTLNPGQFRKIMRHADWITTPEDLSICTRGVRSDYLYLVSKGQVILRDDGRNVAVGSGNFIGEISFLLDCPATADVIALQGTELVRWDRRKLMSLMHKSVRLSNAIGALFNADIARKLSVSWPKDQAHRE